MKTALAALLVIVSSPALAQVSNAPTGRFVVERYTTGTAKIIELHDSMDDVMQTYQVGRRQAVCEGFRVLTGAERGTCVDVRGEVRSSNNGEGRSRPSR